MSGKTDDTVKGVASTAANAATGNWPGAIVSGVGTLLNFFGGRKASKQQDRIAQQQLNLSRALANEHMRRSQQDGAYRTDLYDALRQRMSRKYPVVAPRREAAVNPLARRNRISRPQVGDPGQQPSLYSALMQQRQQRAAAPRRPTYRAQPQWQGANGNVAGYRG